MIFLNGSEPGSPSERGKSTNLNYPFAVIAYVAGSADIPLVATTVSNGLEVQGKELAELRQVYQKVKFAAAGVAMTGLALTAVPQLADAGTIVMLGGLVVDGLAEARQADLTTKIADNLGVQKAFAYLGQMFS